MGSRENYEQKESMRKGQVFSVIERMYNRRRYLGKQRGPEEYNGIGRRI